MERDLTSVSIQLLEKPLVGRAGGMWKRVRGKETALHPLDQKRCESWSESESFVLVRETSATENTLKFTGRKVTSKVCLRFLITFYMFRKTAMPIMTGQPLVLSQKPFRQTSPRIPTRINVKTQRAQTPQEPSFACCHSFPAASPISNTTPGSQRHEHRCHRTLALRHAHRAPHRSGCRGHLPGYRSEGRGSRSGLRQHGRRYPRGCAASSASYHPSLDSHRRLRQAY